MYFVGREREMREVKRTLEEGNNVIVSGKFGMGRTSLIKHIADTHDQWRFIFLDFSKPPGHVCNHLLVELFPKRRSGREYVKYKSSRFQILTRDLEDNRKHILVLDDIAKLTSPKLDLLRHLTWESRFLFIAIVESFLPRNDLFQLRTWLNPSVMISLRRLNIRDGVEFFKRYAKVHHLDWTESQITGLAMAAGGYPLRMKEISARELQGHTDGKPV